MASANPASAFDDDAACATLDACTRHPTVLLVEDEVLIRFFLAEELRAQRWMVLEAANAEEALALLATEIAVDLLLTDVRMPGPLDGAALARQTRRDHPAMKVVVVSGHLRESELGVEVHGFFAKPVDIPRLARHIRALVEGRCAQVTAFGPAASRR